MTMFIVTISTYQIIWKITQGYLTNGEQTLSCDTQYAEINKTVTTQNKE